MVLGENRIAYIYCMEALLLFLWLSSSELYHGAIWSHGAIGHKVKSNLF